MSHTALLLLLWVYFDGDTFTEVTSKYLPCGTVVLKQSMRTTSSIVLKKN